MQKDQQNLKQDTSSLLFAKNFISHPQDVVDYAYYMRKQMEDFIDAFKKRIQIQVSYSKQLSQLSRSLQKYIRPGTQLTSSFIASAFKVQHQSRSRQATELAQSLKLQIEVVCGQLLREMTIDLKKIEKDVKRYYKQISNLQNNHEYQLEKYLNVNKQMQEMIITKNIMSYSVGIPQEKRVKLIAKTIDTISQNRQLQKLYLNSVNEKLSSVIIEKSRQITQQLDRIQNQISQQMALQADSIRKMIVGEVGMFKNIEYDLLNISQQMQALDTRKQVQIFNQQQVNNKNRLIVKTRQQTESSALNKSQIVQNNGHLKQIEVIDKSLLKESLQYVQEDYFGWMLANKVTQKKIQKHPKLLGLVNRVWQLYRHQQNRIKKAPEQKLQDNKVSQQGEKDKNESNIRQEYAQQLSEYIFSLKIQQPPDILQPNTRKGKIPQNKQLQNSFLQIIKAISQLWGKKYNDSIIVDQILKNLEKQLSKHHLSRVFAYVFIKEYRRRHEVLIESQQKAKICGKVIRTILDESIRQRDVFILRGILGLIFTFYWNSQNGNQLLFMIPQIYQSQIWKNNQFWEAAIFEKTFEQLSCLGVEKGQTQSETVLRQKNMIFSQLASFCHNMVMLGISSKNVRIIVGRYCLLYDLSEQHNRDLSKMITNTTKQFKEANKQASPVNKI